MIILLLNDIFFIAFNICWSRKMVVRIFKNRNIKLLKNKHLFLKENKVRKLTGTTGEVLTIFATEWPSCKTYYTLSYTLKFVYLFFIFNSWRTLCLCCSERCNKYCCDKFNNCIVIFLYLIIRKMPFCKFQLKFLLYFTINFCFYNLNQFCN